MADHPDRSTHFATLFETITDQSTFTEQQEIEIPVRYDGHNDGTDIADYLDTTATDQGLDDVIEEPETR
jgi:allophanate hydrolase subunit 1